MLSEEEKKSLKEKYRMITVEKISSPEGMPGSDWHRYVIGQGRSRIEGMKPGTLKAVTEYAEEFAENLNSRASGKYSTYAPRKKK
jgi:hypothetical protein